jgi:hypothetical protein
MQTPDIHHDEVMMPAVTEKLEIVSCDNPPDMKTFLSELSVLMHK